MAQNVDINVNVNGRIASTQISKITNSLNKMGGASAGIEKVNASIKKTGTVAKVASGGVRRLAGSVGALVAAYAGFSAVVSATRDVIEFNRAIAEVQTIANLGRKPLNDLKLSLLDISAATGRSATEATRTFYQIQSAGITDTVKAQKTLEASLKLSVGGLANAETATLALTKALAIYEDQLEGPAKAADILFRGVELGQTRMEELASAIPQVLGPAKNLGIRFDEITGAVASFSKRAGSTAIAVTQLNSIFSGLSRNQDRAGKVLGKNANLFTFQALKAKGLTKFLKDLTDALGGSNDALFELFGRKEAVVGVLSAYADGFKDLGETIEAAKDNTGASERAFQKVINSIGGQLDVFRERARAIILRLGIRGEDTIVNTLKSVNESLMDLQKNVGSIINQVKAALITVGVVGFTTFSVRAIAALRAIQVQFLQTRAIAAASLTGMRVSLKGFVASLTAAKFAVVSFKAAATLGLSIVLDVIIFKLLEAEQRLGSWSAVIDRIANPFKVFFKNIELLVDKGIEKFRQLRVGLAALGKVASESTFGKFIGLQFNESGFQNLITKWNESKTAIVQTRNELEALERKYDETQSKFGTGELLKRPADPMKNLFALPFDDNKQFVVPEDIGIPGVPSEDKVNKQLGNIKEAVIRFNAEMDMIREQRQILAEEQKIQLRVAEGEATAEDFEKLRNIEIEKINIAFEAERKKTELIGNEEKRRLELQKLNAKQTLAVEKAKSKAEVKLTQQKAALKLKSEQQNVRLIAATGTLGAALAKEGSKAQFLIQKASAIAGSIVATKLAYIQALKNPPGPPYTEPFARKVAIIGGINTAAIAATAIKGFRTGGIVPGTPTGGRDSVLAQVEPREAIFTRNQQARLFQIANGDEAGGSNAVVQAIRSLANAMMGQTTSVEIDGRQVALAVREQRLAGVEI